MKNDEEYPKIRTMYVDADADTRVMVWYVECDCGYESRNLHSLASAVRCARDHDCNDDEEDEDG